MMVKGGAKARFIALLGAVVVGLLVGQVTDRTAVGKQAAAMMPSDISVEAQAGTPLSITLNLTPALRALLP